MIPLVVVTLLSSNKTKLFAVEEKKEYVLPKTIKACRLNVNIKVNKIMCNQIL